MKKTLLLSAFLLCTVWMSYGQWTYTNLSSPKKLMAIASLGSKAYFAGGNDGTNTLSMVESYDVETGSWANTGNLSIARQASSGVACGSKIFFGGGVNINMDIVYSTVDIYDIGSGQWSVQELSVARFDIAAVSKGTKVLFAGGCNYNIFCTNAVDIYDVSAGSWSTQYLSSARAGMAYAVVGNLAVFAGGFNTGGGVSARVDIYDFETDTWSTANLSEARVWASAVTVNDKVIVAGGIKSFPDVPSDRVDIFNSSDGTWTTATLSEARAWISAGAVNDKAYFAGGSNVANGGIPYDFTNTIDVYDEASNSWDNNVLDQPRQSQGIALGDYLIVAGGSSEAGLLSSVEIFHDPTLINVPDNYSSIQEAINAASDGDTVLVAENTYYENINFWGKHILIASEFLLDEDTNHISNTIIDGSQPVDPDFGSVVTFRSGEDTTSVLCGFTITGGTGTIEPSVDYRMGGGVQIAFSGAKLLNNIIRDNIVSYNSGVYGGGIQAGGPLENLPWVVMRNNRIRNNKAISSEVYGMGGGIVVFYNLILVDNEISYNEVDCPSGCDGGGASLNASFGPTRLDIRNNLVTHNKAVSLGIGSDYTIGGGLVIAFESSGIVSGNDISYNQIESADDTWGQATGVLVQQVIADDFVFENNFITNNTHVGEFCLGGGMLLYDCGGEFRNNVVQNNTGTHGAGIAIEDSPDNQPAFINNTVTGNTATVYGGGLYLDNASANVINTIIWGNTALSGASIYELQSVLEVRYSDVEGDGIWWPGEGNITVDPQFLEDGYHIDQYSPCEDQGADSISIGETWYYAPETDLEGTPRPYHMGIDIGADECDIIENIPNPFVSSDPFIQVHVSPNPFSDHTTISYDLENDTQVEISLYDNKGTLVKVLLSGTQSEGSHTLEFDGRDLPAGIYFFRLAVGGQRSAVGGKLVKY